MSLSFPDEFVVLPKSNHHADKLGVEHEGCRGPSWLDESGRQHCPAGPVHDALRCIDDVEVERASGPGHEREPSVGSELTIAGNSPEALVDKPGKSVDLGVRVSPEYCAPVAATLGVTSILRKGLWKHKQAEGIELAPMGSLASAIHNPGTLQYVSTMTLKIFGARAPGHL